MIPTVGFVVVPQILYKHYSGGNDSTKMGNDRSFHVKDIVTGENYFTDTLLYYGYYTNNTLQIGDGLHYSIPYAYFFTIFVLFLVSFILLSFRYAVFKS